MIVGLFRKEPLRRHGGLPPQGRRCCAGSTHVENMDRVRLPGWRRARFATTLAAAPCRP